MPRWIRPLLRSAAAVTAVLVALAALLFLLLQTPAAKRLAAERLATELAAVTGFTVDIGGLEGTLPFSAAVTDVRLGDAGGPWLTVDRLAIDWRPMDLLHRRLHVTGIVAGTVALTHLPVSPKPERAEKGIDLAIALPRLPVPTTIDGLRVQRIIVSPSVLGEAAILELTGRAELGGAARDAALTLAAARIDGRAGHASLQLGQGGTPARLTLTASIEEPAGGLIARALSLPGLPPVSLTLGGEGPATAWRGTLQVVAGSTRLDGDLTLAVDDALALELRAHAQDAGRLAPVVADYVPPALDLATRLRWQPGERLEIQQLSVAAPEVTAAVTGGIDLADNTVQASVDLAVADATRWHPLLAPTSLRAAHLSGSIAGTLDRPTFALQTTVDGLTTPDIAVAHAEGTIGGDATLQDGHLVTDLSIAGEGRASGLSAVAPPLQAMIGDSATWSLRAALDLLQGDAEIAQARLAANGSTVDVAGSLRGYGRAVDARLQAELASIAPLAEPLGRPVGGRLSLTAKLSGDAVAGQLAADVDARFADLTLDEPVAMRLLGAAPTVTGSIATRPAGLAIHAVTIEGAGGSATADGTVALDGRSLDLKLAATAADIAPIADALGVSAAGRLAGTVRLTRTVADPGVRFAATADLDDLAVDERAADLLGPTVHATAAGKLAAAAVQLDAAYVAGAAVTLEANGAAGDDLDLAYRLGLPNLAALSRLADTALAGSATISGTLRGSRDAPILSGALSAESLQVTDLPIASASGRFSARDLGAYPEGDLALDLLARDQRLSIATDYRRKEDGTLTLSDLTLTAPQGSASGDLSLLPTGLLDGRIRGDIRDLAPIGAFIDRSIAGAATLDLSFAARRGQAIDAKVDVRNPSFATGAGAPLSARQLTLEAHVTDAFGALGGTAELRITEAARGALSLTRGLLSAEGDAKSLTVRLQAEGKQGRPFAVDAAGALAASAAEQRLRLDRLEGSFGSVKARLNAPATISHDARGYALAGLDASIGDGRLTGAGGIGAKQVDLRLSLVDLPLETLVAFAPQLDIGGKAAATLRLAGTSSAPTAHGDIRLTALSVAGTKISEATGIGGTINLDVRDGRAAVAAHLGGSPDLSIDGQLTAPLAFRLQPFAADFAADAPITGKVVGQVDLGLVPRLVDLHGDTLGGRLALDMAVTGTAGAPRLGGDARVSAGSYASADAGTVLRDVTAVISGDNDRVLLRSFAASDGGRGRLEASGSAALGRDVAARYDGTLTLKSFTVVNRTDAVATASGSLKVENDAQGSRLAGDVTVESAELRVPDSLPPKIVKLDVVEINTPPDRVRPAVRPTQEGAGLPVALAVTVRIPGRAFLRGRGIDSEWRGKLRVAGTMAKPDITGRLEVVRGRVDLLGQPFNVDNGAVNFVGGGAIDPELDFTAIGQAQDVMARVRVTGRVSQPKFELGTDSGLPPEEAMSRLLFGKSAGSLSSAQAVQLAQAAAELSGGGPGVLDKLRRTFGLDVLRVGTTSGSPDSASVEAGKYVSEDVYLKVEQGLTPESRQVGVEVRVLPRVTVEGGVGAQGSGKVGVNWRYDY